MRTTIKTTVAPELKRMTLPFIGRSLKSMGMDAQRDGNAYYVDLGHDSCLVIGFQRGRISVAVVMPAEWDAVEELLFSASLTMASTTLTKVFLLPEDNEMHIWFSAESFCKTRGEFEEVFDALFKQLMKSVRTFVDICDNISETMRAQALAAFVAGQADSQQPS
jgi:hypothetical protein